MQSLLSPVSSNFQLDLTPDLTYDYVVNGVFVGSRSYCHFCGKYDLMYLHCLGISSFVCVFICESCRSSIIGWRGFHCQRCHSSSRLLLHHLCYYPEITVIVCFKCHYKIHFDFIDDSWRWVF